MLRGPQADSSEVSDQEERRSRGKISRGASEEYLGGRGDKRERSRTDKKKKSP